MLCSLTSHDPLFRRQQQEWGGKFMIQTIRLDQAQYVGTSESKGNVSLPAVHQEMLGAAERLMGQSPHEVVHRLVVPAPSERLMTCAVVTMS